MSQHAGARPVNGGDEDGPSAQAVSPSGALRGSGAPPWARRWRATAGVVAAVAILVLVDGTANAAATQRKPSKTEIATVAAGPSTGADHGEFVVIHQDGTRQIRRWQWGEVVTLDDSSIMAGSADGFTSEYQINTGVIIEGLAIGETVTVVGTVDGPPTDSTP